MNTYEIVFQSLARTTCGSITSAEEIPSTTIKADYYDLSSIEGHLIAQFWNELPEWSATDYHGPRKLVASAIMQSGDYVRLNQDNTRLVRDDCDHTQSTESVSEPDSRPIANEVSV